MMMKESLDPVEHEAFATIDNALLRLVSRLDPQEVSAWSVLRFMFERDKRGDLLASQEQTPDPGVLRIAARQCEHGLWNSHNAWRMPDGSVVDDPAGLCEGGVLEVEGGVFYTSMAVAKYLADIAALVGFHPQPEGDER